MKSASEFIATFDPTAHVRPSHSHLRILVLLSYMYFVFWVWKKLNWKHLRSWSRGALVRWLCPFLSGSFDSLITVHSCILGFQQQLLDADALKSRYADKLPPEPRMSSFKKASVSTMIPDPDVPPGYDLQSSEYVFLEPFFSWISKFVKIDAIFPGSFFGTYLSLDCVYFAQILNLHTVARQPAYIRCCKIEVLLPLSVSKNLCF